MRDTLQQSDPAVPAYTSDNERWAAVQARDARADSHFVYAVASTGVYCRPSCGSRLPRRENVSFHPGPEAAQAAGFRPCKRCRPDAPSPAGQRVAMVTAACRQLEAVDPPPSLDDLSAAAGLSRFHFHRLFKSITGVTPRQYAASHRAGRVRQALRGGGSVTDAIYSAGYNASSRFYEEASHQLGMLPGEYRDGGRGVTIRFAVGECSLGSVLVAASGKGVCAIALGDDPEYLLRELQDQFPRADLVGADATFEDTVAQVVGMIDHPTARVELPLDVRGTLFQRQVWAALRAIPPGRTLSYAEVARVIGRPDAARAVARACASNTLAVAIPCHRVVRADGGLSGYRWGVERKRALLDRERERS